MTNNSIVLDTNILFAYFVEEDSLHSRSREILEYLERDSVEIVLHYGVLLETSTLLARRFGKELADVFIRAVID